MKKKNEHKNCAKCFNSTRDINTLELTCTKGVDIINTWTNAQWCDYYCDNKPKYEQLSLFEETIDRELATQTKKLKKHSTKWTLKKSQEKM